MITISKYLCLLAVASAGFLTQAQAQRRGGDNRGGGGNWGRSEQRGGNTGGYSRGNSGSYGGGNFGGNRMDQRRDMGGQNTPSSPASPDRQANRRFDPPAQNRGGGGFTQRNPADQRGSNGSFDRSNSFGRNNNNGFDRRNSSFDRQRSGNVYNGRSSSRIIVNNNRYYSGGYNRRFDNRSYSGYRYYAPRRYAYVGAPRYSVLPRTWLSISFGGYPYYYNSGLFYSYYDGYYSPVFAPIGIHIGVLPVGYYPFYLGPTRYYYYSGVYYRDYDNGQYEVVDAPMGAQVSALPKGATLAIVNGEKFYEFNGTYYREETNSRNEVVYTVVGKNGEINNSDDEGNNAPPPSSGLHVGDIIPDLPEGSRSVTINGEALFLSPDNLYFKQVVNGNETAYQVVGTSQGGN